MKELQESLKTFDYESEVNYPIEKGVQYSHYTGVLRQNILDAFYFAGICDNKEMRNDFIDHGKKCITALTKLIAKLDILNGNV